MNISDKHIEMLLQWEARRVKLESLAPDLPEGDFREYLISSASTGSGIEFFLEHGRYWKPGTVPSWLEQGIPQYCFDNAQCLALARPELTYVEGYATFAWVVPHGWCIDEHGQVVDPTCEDPTNVQYFGIAIDTQHLADIRQASSEATLFFGYRGADLRERIADIKSTRWHSGF